LPCNPRLSILKRVKHVAILGPAGAGKSWLSRSLSEAIRVPVIHLDRLYWQPNWVPMPEPEWEALLRREVVRESWIADGIQEGRVFPQLWLDAADTIVFIDASTLSCIWRVTRRRFDASDGPEMPADCKPAPFYRAFAKFLRLQWLYRRKVRGELLADLARRQERQQVAVLRSEEEVRRFLADAKAQHGALGESVLT
jgi:adenylate kinase family enzyme